MLDKIKIKKKNLPKIIIATVILLVAAITLSFAMVFTANGLTLAFPDATSYNTSQPKIVVGVLGEQNLDTSSAAVYIDGQEIKADFTLKMKMDVNSEVYVLDNPKEGSVLLISDALAEGSHTLRVGLKDVSGNSITKDWDFTIVQKPVFSELTPRNGAVVKTKSPIIKAIIKDPNGTINKNSIKLSYNGAEVQPTVLEIYGYVSVSYAAYTPINAPQNVVLLAEDDAGNANSVSWSFKVDAKDDMQASSDDCGSCHTLNTNHKYTHSKGPLGITTLNNKPTHFYGFACSHCHREYSDKTCGYCHGGDIMPNVKDPNWRNTWVRPVANPALSAGQDCTYCHSLNNSGWVPNNYRAHKFYLIKGMVNTGVTPLVSANPKVPLTIIHEIGQEHKTEKDFCNQCHSEYLTREHNRISTKSGEQITCQDCHEETAPQKYKDAIASKNTNCEACHDNIDHSSFHTSPLDASCQTCHSATVSGAHTAPGFTCANCHDSDNVKVNRAVNNKNLNCAACHKESVTHNILLEEAFPTEIPLYAGFQWSSIIEAAILKDEIGFPVGYENGIMITSNSISGVAVRNIWNFYLSKLTIEAQDGANWTLKSDAPVPTALEFTAEFTKEDHSVTVKCFNDSSGENPGTRIELWYK